LCSKSFVDVLDRQTSKIVDYYKQQMNMEQEDHMKRTRLEEAEKAWEEQNALDRDTFMEQSLAATMIALEADFDSPRSSPRESPRGSLKGDDEDEIEDGVDLDPPLEDDMMMNTNGGRSGRSGRSAGRRLVSSLPPSALRRSGGMNNGINGGMNNAGRKTAHFDDDKNRQKRMNRTFNGASSNGGAYDDDMLERKTIMFDEESPKRRSPRENRRTSFMAIETIKETYDAIIDSPKNTVGNTGERLHKTMPTTLKEGVEAEERVEAGLGEGVVGGTELSAVKQMKRGHRRRATVADATPRRQEDRNSSPTAKMSPTTETRHARKLLNKLFHNVIVSCEKNQINSDEYVKEEFFKCKSIATGNTSGTSKATDAALTYEQFMTFLINMETNVENTLNISIGIMEMPAERIDVAFSIFDVVGDLTITLESVVRFMRNISSTRSTAGSNGGNDNIGGSDEMVEKEDFMEEEAQTQFRLAIQQVIKGASWVARKDKLTMERVIKDAFVERDADGTGKVTTGQFAQIVYQLGIEMTRSMNESLLKELGVEASNQPNDRCVDYKKLIKFCETM
jgi:Ca2+-binding EF-hand superfamily protein